MRDAILIVGGGLLQIPAVLAAESLGLAAIVTDRDSNAPCLALADQAVILDTYDAQGHALLVTELASRFKLRGVFTEGADVEVTVATAAQAAGVPGIPISSAYNTKDKVRMRRCLTTWGVDKTRWVEVADLASAIAAAAEIGYPLVVKATDNCASRGTRRVANEHALLEAVESAVLASTTGTALIEEMLTGPEQSCEILFCGKDVIRLNVVDRIFGIDDMFALELGHVNPSHLPKHMTDEIFGLVERAAQATGVSFGAFKADTIMTTDGPRILEVTARLSGGFDCQRTTPLATGRNFIRAAMCVALGESPRPEDLRYKRKRYAAAWSALPSPGTVVSIGDTRPLLARDGVREVIFRVKEGDVIPSYSDCGVRPAFVIVEGATYEESYERAKLAAAQVPIETVPV